MSIMPKVYTAFDRPKDPGISCPEPTLAQQHFAEDADINNIVERYQRTGLLVDPAQVNESRRAIYGDFTNAPDFYAAQAAILKAEEAFLQLPPKLRLRFNNNPAELIDFLDSPDNLKEAVELGLVQSKPVDPPPATPPQGGSTTPTT